MSTEALTKVLVELNATEAAERKAWAKLQDETQFINEPKAHADQNLWSKAPYWDLDEATALSLGKDPHFVNLANIKPLADVSPFAEQYEKLRFLIMRAKAAGDLPNEVSPGYFVCWAEQTEIDLPVELKDAVKAAVERIEDRERLVSERDSLQAEVEKLRAELHAEGALDPRERKSLMSLVLGMAKEKYHYNATASGSSVVKNICGTLERQGLKLSDDAVRNWLRRASESLSDL